MNQATERGESALTEALDLEAVEGADGYVVMDSAVVPKISSFTRIEAVCLFCRAVDPIPRPLAACHSVPGALKGGAIPTPRGWQLSRVYPGKGERREDCQSLARRYAHVVYSNGVLPHCTRPI